MSVWGEHAVEGKIIRILRETPYQEAHHFGRPYLSAYQLAIAVAAAGPKCVLPSAIRRLVAWVLEPAIAWPNTWQASCRDGSNPVT